MAATTLPTAAYQKYVLGQLAIGGLDPVTGTNLPAQPAEVPFYKNMFSLLPAPGGSPVAITGCPLDASGNLSPAPTNGTLLNGNGNGSGCAAQRQRSLNNRDSEDLIVSTLHKFRYIYITKTFPIKEGIKLRIDGQLFNAFNHPDFALPETVQAGVPGSAMSRFGTLQSTTSPPTGLLGVGLGGDTSPRMIAFQGRIEF